MASCEGCAHWMRRAFDDLQAPCAMRGASWFWSEPACGSYERRPRRDDDPARLTVLMGNGILARIIRPCSHPDGRRARQGRMTALFSTCVRDRQPLWAEMLPGCSITCGPDRLTALNVPQCVGILEDE